MGHTEPGYAKYAPATKFSIEFSNFPFGSLRASWRARYNISGRILHRQTHVLHYIIIAAAAARYSEIYTHTHTHTDTSSRDPEVIKKLIKFNVSRKTAVCALSRWRTIITYHLVWTIRFTTAMFRAKNFWSRTHARRPYNTVVVLSRLAALNSRCRYII